MLLTISFENPPVWRLSLRLTSENPMTNTARGVESRKQEPVSMQLMEVVDLGGLQIQGWVKDIYSPKRHGDLCKH